MIRRDAIKSIGILTAGIVSGATLITDGAISLLLGYPDVKTHRCPGGLMTYIQHNIKPEMILSRRECEEFLGDLT